MARKGEYKANASKRSKQQREYNSSPEQKKRRAARNAARRKLMKEGRVKKGDGKDVEHKNKNARDNSNGNITVRDRSANRADNRGTGGRKKKSKPTKKRSS
jgi:hypothetical protein